MGRPQTMRTPGPDSGRRVIALPWRKQQRGEGRGGDPGRGPPCTKVGAGVTGQPHQDEPECLCQGPMT